MNQRPVVISLVVLCGFLAGLGTCFHDTAVLTMAASCLAGLFAFLNPAHKDQ